jgi:beta-galactosidase
MKNNFLFHPQNLKKLLDSLMTLRENLSRKGAKAQSMISLSLVFFMLISLSCSEKQNSFGQKTNFNTDWKFKIDEKATIDNVNDAEEADFLAWEEVNLPHTPKLEPLLVNDQWQGNAWYQKEFDLAESHKNKKLFLKFEAAMNIAEVWVNGEKLAKHYGGYLPFVVNFTEVAEFDQVNSVIVKLNNEDSNITGPKPLEKLDFNTYGGLYRNVWLISKNKLHITDPIFANKPASGGVFVRYAAVSDESATVNIQTHVKNESDENQSFIIRQSLIKNDSVVASTESKSSSLQPKTETEIEVNLLVKKPQLWSPDYPNLYDLKTEIIQNENVIDQIITTIGIKTMKFEGQEFYLNGKKTFLRGVNRHQEYPYIGYALSDQANYRDAKKIKEAGFDYVRISHYPQSPAFMRACDELGLMTIDAILGWQYFNEEEAFQQHVFQTARDLIRRDRNHASVLAWEVSLNESWMPEAFIDSLTNIAKQEYPGDQCFTAGWQSYGYDIYLQARQHRLQHYDSTLTKPYVVSEYGDWEYYAMNAGLNQDNWGDLLQEERSSRQLRSAGEKALLQQATNIQEAHNDNLSTPAFADGYWVMYDYNRGYADDLEASGIMDIFRLPKPAYYFYQSQRSADTPFGKPMVYIANQWKKDSSLDVRIFSNAEEVELFVNGKSLGRQKPDDNLISNHLNHPPFTFTVAEFKSGELEAKAFIKDKEVANHVVYTPKEPTQIEVELDLSGYSLDETKEDVVFMYAKIVDDNNTLITNFEGKVEFKLEGNAELIGENPVTVEAGIASILLKTKPDTKEIKIEAKTVEGNLFGGIFSKNLSIILDF